MDVFRITYSNFLKLYFQEMKKILSGSLILEYLNLKLSHVFTASEVHKACFHNQFRQLLHCLSSSESIFKDAFVSAAFCSAFVSCELHKAFLETVFCTLKREGV